MSVSSSTYFDFTRVREQGPDAKDWASTDANWELAGLLLKQFASHSHTGTSAINYPGYGVTGPPPTLTTNSTGGTLSPGSVIGVRMAYRNALGLETQGSPEVTITLPAATDRPLPPTKTAQAAAAGAIPGGTYVYVITKKKGSGETLISDILAVDVPFDQTYSNTLGFDAISTYTDGTTALCIYRSAGLSSSFQLVKTITNTTSTTYVDNNVIESVNTQPPSANTFDASKKVTINWSAITHPGTATTLIIYVTQQAGMWSTQHILTEVDLTASPGNFVDYLGNETLGAGWPRNATQIPDAPAKINPATDLLSANIPFGGFQALNMVLHNTTSPTTSNGAIYYDTSLNMVRARINGAWVNWGTTTASAYTHPAEESGGHIAANIKFSAGSATTLKTIADRITNTDGTQKSLGKVYKVIGSTSDPTTTSSSMAQIPDMVLNGTTPNFTGQYMEVTFSGHFFVDTIIQSLSVAISVNDIVAAESIRSYTTATLNQNIPMSTTYTFAMDTPTDQKMIKALWWISLGTAQAVGIRRSLVAKVLA